MTMTKDLAVLGGTPCFPEMVDIVGPVLPPLEKISDRLDIALKTGKLTNNSQHLREFENAAADFLAVKHAVAVANGTLSLVLLLKGLGCTGKAIIPSFTYIATAHAVVWAGLTPVFADIDPDTYNITPETIERVLTDDVSVIIPVHVFGNPCDVEGIQKLADKKGLAVVYDSAHAFGSTISGRRIGSFGNGESFSMHATKALPVGEGGMMTTNDDKLAEWLRAARVFGDYGDHDAVFPGINAKLGEFAALLGLEGLSRYPEMLDARAEVAKVYTETLKELPGVKFQRWVANSSSTNQNFSIQIDPMEFGLTRDQLCVALAAENIMSRKYFWPPVHQHKAYRQMKISDDDLPETTKVTSQILCLPMHPSKPLDLTQKIAVSICRIWEERDGVSIALQRASNP